MLTTKKSLPVADSCRYLFIDALCHRGGVHGVELVYRLTLTASFLLES